MVKQIFKVLLLFLCLLSASEIRAQNTLQVGLLLDVKNDELIPLLSQLESEIRAVVGNDALVVIEPDNIKVNRFDAEIAEQNYKAMLSSNVDIILAFGPTNNALITAQSSYSKPTILFGAVNSDLIELDKKKTSSGIPNFTYIVTPISYREDLKALQTVYPAKRIGVIGAYGALQDPIIKQSLAATFSTLGIDYELISYNSVNTLEAKLENVDAVYLAEGFGLSTAELTGMSELFLRLELPSFSSNRIEDVEPAG